MGIMFQGGPLDGQTGVDPLAPPDTGGGEDLSESDLLNRMLSDARAVLDKGELAESSKLLIEKATTLLQQIKAQEEKESEAAMGGKLSPRLMSKAYGGGQ